MRFLSLLGTVAALLALTAPLSAQSNLRPGTDVSLGILGPIDEVGRSGTYPNGTQAVAMETTSCNLGSVNVPWAAAMGEDHPLIAFLVARETNGRLIQISDRSYLKHGFYALSDSQCTPCRNPSNGSFLGVGCSDTYAIGNNSDNYWLGPPAEIDPWLGTWTARCSFFDLGTSGVTCDGNRSFTQTQARGLGPVGNRVRLQDSDLSVAGSTFWYQGMYVIRGEPEAVRTNNLTSRGMTATWTGASWNVSTNSVPQLFGSVLQRWSGATMSSAANGAADGRVYLAHRVTRNTGGFHYEYALHNRDNAGAISSFTLPICPGTSIRNFGFHDVDQSAANEWTMSVQGAQVVFTAPAGNALEWNTIFNFWFDSDAAPVSSSSILLGQARLNAGAQPAFAIDGVAPLGRFNVYLGAGCGAPNAPVMTPGGLVPRAIPGNQGFGFDVSLAGSGSTVVLLGSIYSGTTNLAPGCDLYMSLLPGQDYITFLSATMGPLGTGFLALPVPLLPALEGLAIDFQAVEVQPGSGALFGAYDLSNGWRVRFGAGITTCP
ncbi:MAG: hypothetical protein IPN34_02615 [Planctomycetes bacterium]|nr:hypothetical protein [Planctomycetota bacterium]